MRTTLTIDDDALEDAKIIARAEHRSLGTVISALARRSLAPIGIRETNGPPVFDVGEDAPTIDAADVARAIDEHG